MKIGSPALPLVLLFGLHLAIGVALVDDYGVPVDEIGNLHKGRVTLHYVNASLGRYSPEQAARAMADWEQLQAKYYGTFFEALMTQVSDTLGLEDVGDMIRLRHRVVFFLFWLSGLALFGILRLSGLTRVLSLGAWALYILHPRIFSSAFYNHKDLVFLSACTITVYFLCLWLLPGNRSAAGLFVVSAAVATAIRVMGIEFLVLGLAWWALRVAGGERGWRGLRARWPVPVLALCGFALVLFACWPFLWSNPLARFEKGFAVMARFTQYGGTSLLGGRVYPSNALPMSYVAHWFAVTTPLLTLTLLAGGLFALGLGLVRRFRDTLGSDAGQLGLLACAWVFGTVGAIVLKRSVLYDGWRQVYFIWPGLVLAASCGWGLGWTHLGRTGRRLTLALLGLAVLQPIPYLVRAHPHGMVYFNAMAGKPIEGRYEMDYWGLGYRAGLEFLARHQPEGEIRVHDTFWRGLYIRGNLALLPPADRDRFVSVRDVAEADYLITNYRPGEQVRTFTRGEPPLHRPLYEARADRVPVVGVYALR